ncbi:zf-PARP-domain-containing protein [Lophiostoma macrostomum CBS 122681]|uniref:Zf-PARP-domain-containing protein n=1 Tax=Lophiostoma macrostomum CBS 122681 TaxID=1314788 RepID=A0A6A6T008_9PLEO|nr:zf-PARP-domain-containing protein [Lophiostoma macrostomum CBS 122681]
MPSYRIEISPNNRATCNNTECKKAGAKLLKGEIRWGTLVTIKEHNSWAWRHWGCVTPQVIANVRDFIDGDKDLLDGYDELPTESQAKIDYALENGHVPDEDWKGDLDVNRPGQKGFRIKTPKKKKGKKGDEEDEVDDGSPKPKKKKRARAAKDEDEEDAPAPKKAKGKKAAVKDEDSEDEPKPPKKARAKKAAAKDEEPGEEESKPRKGRARKAAVYKEESSDEEALNEDSEEVEAPKAKRVKKAAAADKEKPAPQKRGRKKKATTEE